MQTKTGTIPINYATEDENFSGDGQGFFEDETEDELSGQENAAEEGEAKPEGQEKENDAEEKSDLDKYIEELEGKKGEEQPTAEKTEEKPAELPEYEKQFETTFEKKFGMPVNDALSMVNELLTFKAQLEAFGGAPYLAQMGIERQESQLMNDWGVDRGEFDQRMKAVRAYYQTLSPKKQSALDDVDGAKIIWTQIEKELERKGIQTPSVSRNSRGTSPQGRVSNPRKVYKMSEIIDLPEEEYARINWNDIEPDAIEYDNSYIRAF